MPLAETSLFRRAFESTEGDPSGRIRGRLVSALDLFRDRASVMAEAIRSTVPSLTDHSVQHLDALWEMAGIVAGPRVSLNPAEAFIFGGAVLLHDLANAVAAFPNGVTDLHGPHWNDLVTMEYEVRLSRKPTAAELTGPQQDILEAVLLQRLRQVHSEQAKKLASLGFYRRDGSTPTPPMYLIEDSELRRDLGALIGIIAASHHWDIDEVVRELSSVRGVPPYLPAEWQIDPLKIALMLRCADAAHLDSRRAPEFVRRLVNISADSRDHWEFQSRLLRPIVHDEELVYSGTREFEQTERAAWWLCYESLSMVDRELRSADAVLRIQRPWRFAARGVAGSSSPDALRRHVKTVGWFPVDVRIKITDVLGVVERFGGRRLYGESLTAPLRELIANAVDSVRARRFLDSRPDDWGEVVVRIGKEGATWWLEVEDTGIGMSESVLSGPLLDFGTSYWKSGLARREHPGLIASDFRPTGKFGIGFFSVFMLGERVRVVSRQYHLGRETARALELEKGERTRPYIRQAQARGEESLPDGGTKVRVWLSAPPFDQGGLFSPVYGSAKKTLTSTIQRLGVAVDVLLRVEHAEASISEVVVRPRDWQTIANSELLERTSPYLSSSDAARLPLVNIVRDGQLIARMGVSAATLGMQSGGLLFSVGGFATETRGNLVAGVVLATEPDLARKEGTPTPTRKEVRDALAGFLPSLSNLSPFLARRATQMYLNLGVVPRALRCFLLNERAADADQVRAWASNHGSVRVVFSDSFEIPARRGNSTDTIEFADVRGEWDHPEDLVIVGDTESSPFAAAGEIHRTIAARRAPWRAASLIDGVLTPNTIPGLALHAIAEAWGVDPEELWEDAEEQDEVIGEYSDHYGTEEISVTVCTLTRPSDEE